ncbi:MAG: hypothetical protein U1D30_02340 [Planctomycetota bacterium]
MAKTKKKPLNRVVSISSRDYRKGMRYLGVVMVLASLLGLFYFAGGRVSEVLANSDDNVITARDIQITPVPAWIRADLLGSALVAAGVDENRVSLGERNLVERVGRGIESSPWVSKVEVRKSHRHLGIKVDYRRPVVCVPVGQGDKCCYLAEDGTVLPFAEATPASLETCLVVEGIQVESLPDAGRPIGKPGILAAAQLASLLLEKKESLDLLVIVIGNETSAGFGCELRTRRGSRIAWGTIRPGDPGASREKMSQLQLHRERHGSLEKPRGPYYFDLTQPDSQPVRLADYRGDRDAVRQSPTVRE